MNHPPLFTFGGEFRDRLREASYQTVHLADSIRHSRLLLLAAIIINLVFLLNDWRFWGAPHFPYAIGARTTIIVISLAFFLAAHGVQHFSRLQRLALAWSIPCIIASAILVSPHSDTSLLIIFVLPLIFYLALPLSFLWSVLMGLLCSSLTLGSYITSSPSSKTTAGLIMGMVTSNVILTLVRNRSNRLQRQEWATAATLQKAYRDLSENRHILQSTLQAIPAPVLILDQTNGAVLQDNAAARRFFGKDVLRDPRAIKKYVTRQDTIKLAIALQHQARPAEHETRIHMPDGTSRDVLLVATKAMIGGNEAIVTVIIDITQRKEMEARLERLASIDPLTGLANRGHFFSLATAEIKRSQRYGHPVSIIMFDIDFFKHINDTFGHETGDSALKHCGLLCRTLKREPDIAGRLGGEEFALLLPETEPAKALMLAERLRLAIAQLHIGPHGEGMTVSLGVAAVGNAEKTVDAALSRADQALYVAKNAGRNRSVLHQERS